MTSTGDQQSLRSLEPGANQGAKGSRYHFCPPPYGFVGRADDIRQIEQLLTKHNVLLLQGIGGTGKTTLLHSVQEQWQTTQFAANVFYFGYDQQAWTVAQIFSAIAKQIYGPLAPASLRAMPLTAQVQRLTEHLRGEQYVLILDNLESVTGQDLAIQNTLLPEQQAQIQDFLMGLVGGNTKVVLASRSERIGWLQLCRRTGMS